MEDKTSNKNSGLVFEKKKKKGSSIYVEGQLQTNSYEDKNTGERKFSTQIVAREMQMLGSRNNVDGLQEPSQEMQSQEPPTFDDEIPF